MQKGVGICQLPLFHYKLIESIYTSPPVFAYVEGERCVLLSKKRATKRKLKRVGGESTRAMMSSHRRMLRHRFFMCTLMLYYYTWRCASLLCENLLTHVMKKCVEETRRTENESEAAIRVSVKIQRSGIQRRVGSAA